jgi:hypothetical protein
VTFARGIRDFEPREVNCSEFVIALILARFCTKIQDSRLKSHSSRPEKTPEQKNYESGDGLFSYRLNDPKS